MLPMTVPSTFFTSWMSASAVTRAHALTLSPRNADPRAKATRRGCCALIRLIRELSAYIRGSPFWGGQNCRRLLRKDRANEKRACDGAITGIGLAADTPRYAARPYRLQHP